MSEFNGIDVSTWQDKIDWAKVKASGITNAIIKCGGSDTATPYKDKRFEENYKNACENGILVGVYYFVGAQFYNYNDGVKNAQRCLEILNGRALDYPVFVDVEVTATGRQNEVTEAILAFCGTISQAGYKMGVYGSDISGFKDRFSYDIIKQNPDICLWVARYGSEPKHALAWSIWQSSSSGTVPGISGRVDTNVFKNVESHISVSTEEKPQTVQNNVNKEMAKKIYDIIKKYL